MNQSDFFSQHLAGVPVMGIFRGLGPDETVALCHRAWEAGVTLVEVPVQAPEAMPSLRAAIDAARSAGKFVGAGTVVTLEQLRDVHAAGASFTVAPGFDSAVAAEARKIGLPHLPGVATSTEIGQALSAGYAWLKAFPAAQLGPAWIKAQLAPFPRVKFVATGGMTSQNAQSFLDAGCTAVAFGSVLADPDSLDAISALRRAGA